MLTNVDRSSKLKSQYNYNIHPITDTTTNAAVVQAITIYITMASVTTVIRVCVLSEYSVLPLKMSNEQ